MEVYRMYFPYLRGRQFELIALRELLEGERIGQEIIPIIEPVKPSATLLKTLECFMDEQISSMIASENRHGECEIQSKKECVVYDTNEDHYLEVYLEEIMDAFTVAKHLRVSETDVRVGYLHTFLARWKVFKVDEKSIQKIIKAICRQRYQDEPELFDEKVTIRELFSADEMERKCILKTYSWDDFCYNIKHVNRFHSQQVNFRELKNLLDNMLVDIPAGEFDFISI